VRRHECSEIVKKLAFYFISTVWYNLITPLSVRMSIHFSHQESKPGRIDPFNTVSSDMWVGSSLYGTGQ
jgi:hypothetical protein